MKKERTLLLVEDDPQDIEIIELAIKKAKSNFKLMSVRNGEEAIQYLSRKEKFKDRNKFPEPAVVLLDLSLPIVSGIEVLQWMQRQSHEKMPPVVVLSYAKLESDVNLTNRLGAKSYIQKSSAFEHTAALIEALEKLTQKSWGAVTKTLCASPRHSRKILNLFSE